MNDEIKEILDRIETASEIFDCLLKPEECTELLDYITNLQHQISLMEEDIRENKEINGELQQENERLKELNENASKVCMAEHKYGVDKAEEARDYKTRCEKAIEYTAKQKKKMYKSRNKIAMFILMKLENILQNGSEKDDR